MNVYLIGEFPWGFGFQFDEINKKMTVNKVEETGTAFSEGIRVGDQIVSINGKDVIDLKSFCHELNGTKGLLRIQIQKSVFPKKKDTDIANLIFGSNNMKNNGVKQNNSLEIKELSVKIPRNNFSFPLLPSTASSSSYSSGLEILKHMDVLKSSVKRKKTKERPMFLQNYPKYNLNSVSTVSAHSNYTSSETEETIDSNTFSGNDSGVENNQSGDEETINGLNSDTCSIEKSPLSLNE
uniref:PDZ domain-containing protein n=1 Tax=Rhabditophanes sp. KR3021 TaxID=114890 RepID=A0AC35U7I7_9BILA